MDADHAPVYAALSRDVADFSRYISGIRLRSYQLQVARAVVDSVTQRRGLSFVVVFPRQSGKNELQAQLEAYLGYRFGMLASGAGALQLIWVSASTKRRPGVTVMMATGFYSPSTSSSSEG